MFHNCCEYITQCFSSQENKSEKGSKTKDEQLNQKKTTIKKNDSLDETEIHIKVQDEKQNISANIKYKCDSDNENDSKISKIDNNKFGTEINKNKIRYSKANNMSNILNKSLVFEKVEEISLESGNIKVGNSKLKIDKQVINYSESPNKSKVLEIPLDNQDINHSKGDSSMNTSKLFDFKTKYEHSNSFQSSNSIIGSKNVSSYVDRYKTIVCDPLNTKDLTRLSGLCGTLLLNNSQSLNDGEYVFKSVHVNPSFKLHINYDEKFTEITSKREIVDYTICFYTVIDECVLLLRCNLKSDYIMEFLNQIISPTNVININLVIKELGITSINDDDVYLTDHIKTGYEIYCGLRYFVNNDSHIKITSKIQEMQTILKEFINHGNTNKIDKCHFIFNFTYLNSVIHAFVYHENTTINVKWILNEMNNQYLTFDFYLKDRCMNILISRKEDNNFHTVESITNIGNVFIYENFNLELITYLYKSCKNEKVVSDEKYYDCPILLSKNLYLIRFDEH